MTASSAGSLPELYARLQKTGRDILKLRLAPLPQPKFVMLLERGTELRNALRQSAGKAFKRKRQAKAKGYEATVKRAAQTLAALRPLFGLLRVLRRSAAADLTTAEGRIRYNEFPSALQASKQRLRGLAAGIEGALGRGRSPDETLAEKNGELTALATDIALMSKNVLELRQWAEPKIISSCKIFDKIFHLLETDEALSGTNSEVVFELRGIAYKHVAASGLFDQGFYLDQLPDKGRNVKDSVKHYLTQNKDYAPCRYFSDSHYRTAYAEVSQLRYNPLEHFVRYGEALRYNPGPDIDALWYLESNDDVLDAGISAYRHFVHHGLAEGRPPSARPGQFFSDRYLKKTGCRLAFVGEPTGEETRAWEIVRAHCLARESGPAADIPPDAWQGDEDDFDGFVAGASGLARLRDGVLRAVARSGGRVVYIGANPREDLQYLLEQDCLPLTRICAVTSNYEQFIRWQESEAPLRLHFYPFDDAEGAIPVVEALLNRLAGAEDFPSRRLVQAKTDDRVSQTPLISVVSIIYKKAREMLAFLESLNRQDLARPYEVVLVDDASPDDTTEQVRAWLEEKRSSGLLNRFMQVVILRNEVNSGNCVSRNKGIAAARAEIVLVADGDVVFNSSSLTEHIWAYRCGDCDAVIGFFKYDVNYEFVFDWLTACAINEDVVRAKIVQPLNSSYQNCLLYNSIYDFVTRNVSFRKSCLTDGYFDTSFSYSNNKDSGYGEEDHELAARMYFTGKKIRFVDSSFIVHIRHPDNSYNEDKKIANLRNWNRLIARHPDLLLVDRQYYQWRTEDFLSKTITRKKTSEFQEAYARYAAPDRVKVSIRLSKPLNILTYKWHAPYQYELFKLGRHQFTLVTNIGTRHCNQWDYGQRPLPPNARLTAWEDIDTSRYDFAILPFDETILSPPHGDALSLYCVKAFLTMLLETTHLPRVAICHGSPQNRTRITPVADIGDGIVKSWSALRELLKDIHVVCDSHQTRQEWGFAESSVIRHGFSPQEFPPGSHGRNLCLTLPRNTFEVLPLQRDRAYLEHIRQAIGPDKIEYAAPPPPHPGYEPNTQEWAVAKFQNYTRYLGEFPVFLNPTIGVPMPNFVPMPHLWMEAMMTGTIPVTLRNHDADMFITNGVNGFYADSAEEMAEQILWLIGHEKERREISRQARLSAMDMFNIDRFLSAWSELIARQTG
jgi:glycosyltransferase involved in cell wall biosynthesis